MFWDLNFSGVLRRLSWAVAWAKGSHLVAQYELVADKPENILRSELGRNVVDKHGRTTCFIVRGQREHEVLEASSNRLGLRMLPNQCVNLQSPSTGSC